MLSSAQVVSGDSSFWQYKVYADIRKGSLERGRQTTVGWRFSPNTHVMLLRARWGSLYSLYNKSAGSSDVGFGNYGDRKQPSYNEMHS